MTKQAIVAFLLAASVATPSMAQGTAAPAGTDDVTIKPIVDARLRWEGVDQPATEADAVTLRLRLGAEFKHQSGLSALVEAEGTVALGESYNAFPFAIASSQRRPQFSTIADPENLDLNRAQLQYKGKALTLTLGRQRINLDDQRFVGGVAWRQNEQTFDALRGEAKLGPVNLDATYAISQRSVFGHYAGPREDYEGDFVLLGAGGKLGPVQIKGFAYLLDYDEAFFAANSSQTYGIRATGSFKLAPKATLNLAASYARQSDYGSNPANYAADYAALEASLALKGLTLTAGWEQLGADSSAGRAVQTPMATLHKFNGWADLFLTTPNAGLQDLYLGAGYKFDLKALPGLNAVVAWHRFDSDLGSVKFGEEWDASLGFKIGKRVALLAKYANYDAAGFGVDTEKFWLQLEFSY